MRSKSINEALNYTDDLLLSKGLGLSRSEINSLREIWSKLSQRRTNRK
jgi:adenine-specific DNA-methyltransferase